ncbi:MAG TPA: cupin domain-containing protein [Candidatus Acidoferrales bacterium]|nr:cupin domain-containing protein [Candidatus Acidoferrales bacterium]
MAGRVFVRGLEGEKYNLKAARRARMEAPHVVDQESRGWRDDKAMGHEDASPHSRAKWMLAPGDDPFLTQSIQSHFVAIDPGGSNGGHGHQNEAAFYILQGHGYEIHDRKRYDWQAGDLVVVHNDSRHQHFNGSKTEPALALVVKAKAQYLFLGLTQQGRESTIPDGEESRFGPREDWSRLWTPGVEGRRKVVPAKKEPWQQTRDGRVKWLANRDMDVRLFSVDVFLQEIAAGSRSACHWHMADELFYVLEGSGRTLEWQVEADIEDRYYARVARKPREQRWRAGELLYIPPNTIHQLFAEGGRTLLLGAQNRLFKLLGYDSVVYREDAPGWEGAPPETAGIQRGTAAR